MRLLGRVCRVVAYRQSATSLREVRDNGIEITKLDMRFEIIKTLGKEPNTAALAIYNAAPATRAELQTKPLTVRIEAGYEDSGPRGLFVGNLVHGAPKRDGVDWVSELELADGGRAYDRARVNRSWRAGTPLRSVLSDVASSMGMELPRELAGDPALDTRIPTGEALSGATRDELTRLLRRAGYNWSIQSGALQVLRSDQVVDGQAWEINESTGLVGSPEYSSPGKGKKRTLTLRTLLFPELAPGARFLLSSRAASGLHRILEVRHLGDTAGDDWYTEVEAAPL